MGIGLSIFFACANAFISKTVCKTFFSSVNDFKILVFNEESVASVNHAETTTTIEIWVTQLSNALT